MVGVIYFDKTGNISLKQKLFILKPLSLISHNLLYERLSFYNLMIDRQNINHIDSIELYASFLR